MNVTAPLGLAESGYSRANILHLDFETCCEADLKKVGADVYSRDPSLVVTVVAWAWDNGPVESATAQWLMPGMLPREIKEHLQSGGRFKAWNAAFELAILTNHYKLRLDPAQPICVMQQALHSGLPAALGEAGPAIGADVVKDASAHRLMMQMSKPRKTKTGQSYWHDEPDKLEALRRYCERDVASERDVGKMIVALPKQEQCVSILDRKANERGVRIDLDLVAKLKALAKAEIEALNTECEELTAGAVTSPGTQVQKLVAWLSEQGVTIDDLGKETVGKALQSPEFDRWPAPARRALEIRQEVAKSSLKKLDAMARCAGPDGRVRGQLQYYGAFRTGRFSGRLIQPQNFPRPTVKDVEGLVGRLLDGCGVDEVRKTFGPPLQAVASALRGCLIPADGKVFVIYDLSQIEARVVAWLAGQTDSLEVFSRGEDVYTYMQARLGLPHRNAGKAAVLGLGFGLGHKKFVDYAATYGVTLTEQQSQTVVNDWREANARIVDLWGKADRAVKEAIREFEGETTVEKPITGNLKAAVSKAKSGQPLLTLALPGGRRLYYRNIRIAADLKGREGIVYDGVDQKTKRWGEVRTYGAKLVENLVQATARDVIVEAALRIDGLGLGDLVLSVHDELVFEVPETEAERLNAEIAEEINRRPEWALDLPVASDGGVRRRYGKGETPAKPKAVEIDAKGSVRARTLNEDKPEKKAEALDPTKESLRRETSSRQTRKEESARRSSSDGGHRGPRVKPQPHAYPRPLPDSGVLATEWTLETLFGERKDDAWVTVVADVKDPKHWAGGRYRDLSTAFHTAPKAGHYVNTTIIRAGGHKRWDALAESAWFLFFDDVGDMDRNPNAKIDKDWLDMFGLRPTLVNETSAGNFQYVYAFPEAVDPAVYRGLIKLFKLNPNTCGGFRDGAELTRYGRLPSGINPKQGRDGFKTRLVAASGIKYTPDELAKGFRLGEIKPAAARVTGPDQCPPDEIERLLIGKDAPLRNDGRFATRDAYIELLHFVHGASGGSPEGLDIVIRWGAEQAQDPPDDPERRWNTIHSPRGGADALWWLARKMDGLAAARLAFDFDTEDDADPKADPAERARKKERRRHGKEDERRAGTDLWAQWNAALDRLRTATPRPDFTTGGWIEDRHDGAYAFDPAYRGPVPIRPGITDRLTRGFVAMISAAPNVGKSTYLSLEAMAIAMENESLLGQQGLDWCGDVLIVSNEETRDSIMARWRGQMRTSGVTGQPVMHRLQVWPSKTRLRFGRLQDKAVVPTEEGIAFVEALAKRAERGQAIAFLGLDTLVSLFEGVDENSAAQMDKAIGLLISIADAGFIAIDTVHHTGKAGPTESTTSYRGSSAIFAAVAEMSTLSFLTEEEIVAFKLSPAQARRTLRLKGQRQRDGSIPGFWYFEREVQALTAEDPRDPSRIALKTVATLRAIPALVAPTPDLRTAQRMLWGEQQGGREIRRGAMTGRRHEDQASTILEETLGCSREAAMDVVGALIDAGRARVVVRRGRDRHPIQILEIFEPEEGEDNAF